MNPFAFPGHPDGNNGMSLRDYFAAVALQGLLADHTVEMNTSEYAQWSYQLADDMLEERK